MPFAATDRPSIQCGLMAATLAREGHITTTHHLNLEFARAIGPPAYANFADNRWLIFIGEWLFAYEAFRVKTDRDAYFEACKVSDHQERLGFSLQELSKLRDEAVPEFLDGCLAAISWDTYDLIGFTCTFDQQIPSFALARRIKERYPHVAVVFGGATFDQDNAAEFLRRLSWIDYIAIGEADVSICALASALERKQTPVAVPGLAQRVREQQIVVRDPEIVPTLGDLPDPDYTEYFETLKTAGPRAVATRSIQIPFQSARGCWWGAKQHCTFCSLKDAEMSYRSRAPESVVSELIRQSSRYKQLRFTCTDSILDMRYIDALFPAFKKEGIDGSFFYEVKANLTRDQIRKLAQGGVKQVQPGIESLSTATLDIMKKGTTMLLNLRFLKWARYYGLQSSWNILTGFPGERPEFYERQMQLMPHIAHLQPPTDADNIILEKHAPYVVGDHPWYKNRKPLESYRHIFPEEIFDVKAIALYFTAEPEYVDGIPDALNRLQQAVMKWQNLWRRNPKPVLMYERGADWSRVIDSRGGVACEHYMDQLETAVLEACGDTAVKVPGIMQQLAEKGETTICPEQVEKTCQKLLANRFVVEEDGRFLSLVIPARKA
jgi:ribosomal peptide maturation radical SAM protein 1